MTHILARHKVKHDNPFDQAKVLQVRENRTYDIQVRKSEPGSLFRERALLQRGQNARYVTLLPPRRTPVESKNISPSGLSVKGMDGATQPTIRGIPSQLPRN